MQSGPGFVPTFLYYFVTTTLIGAFVLSKGLDSADQAAIAVNPFQIAIAFGLLAGGVGAFFNSYEQMDFPLKNRGADLKKLQQALAAMGYAEAQVVDQVTVYERSFPSNLFAGKVLVDLGQSPVQISARASRIRSLKKQLN